MNIQKYISSGILEAYAAGELSREEMLEVDRLAESHPEIKVELNEIMQSIQSFGATTNKLPSSKLMDNVLKEIEEGEKEVFLKAVMNDDLKDQRASSKPKLPLWSIAASILFMISLGFNFYFVDRLGQTRKTLDGLTLEQTVLADKIESTNQELDYAKLRIAHFLNKDNVHVRMEGLDISPESYANVFWNKKTNVVFISVDNLPEPPHGHQYQLWAIKDGQSPIDAGIFDHSLLIQELKVIKGSVRSFAVTLEKEGGSPVATVEKTYVKGFLKKS